MLTILRALRQMWPVLGLKWWAPPILIALGLLTALTEGLSITLIIPLLADTPGSASSGLAHWLSFLFDGFAPEHRILLISGCFLAGVLVKNALAFSYGLLSNWLNTGISHRLRSGIQAQLLAASQSWHDAQDSGKVLNTLGSETWRMSSALSVLANMLINGCVVAIFGLLLLTISWPLSLACAAFFLFVSGINRLVTSQVKALGREAVAANESFAHRMLEIFHGLRVVRAFGREADEQKRFEAASLKVRKTFFRMDRLSSLVHPISEVLTAVLLVVILALALRTSGLFPGALAFLVLLYRLQGRLKALDAQRAMLDGFSASVEEVRILLDPASKYRLESGTKRPVASPPEIHFEKVSLSYGVAATPEAAPHALRDVSFIIQPGMTTALAGPSGAGKSTVAALICRFYDPTGGRILANGTNLKDLDLSWWRSQIGIVSQDVHLFHDTVKENISYGKPAACREEIIEAARRAQALDFIESLPEGFDTNLGERGVRLSGGQRQRIALARAFLRDPKILILDEATNALDAAAERLLQDALAAFASGRTIVMIAHRMHTIQQADHVIMLDHGRVIEAGHPRQLSMAGGAFAQACALQSTSIPTNEEVSQSALSNL